MEGEFDVGMGEEVPEPVGIAIVTPLGDHQYNPVTADDECGKQDRPSPSRCATNREQSHDRDLEGRCANPSRVTRNAKGD